MSQAGLPILLLDASRRVCRSRPLAALCIEDGRPGIGEDGGGRWSRSDAGSHDASRRVEAGHSPLFVSRTAAWGLGRTAVVGGLEEMADRFGEIANRVSSPVFL
jgi:hypothetical protein